MRTSCVKLAHQRQLFAVRVPGAGPRDANTLTMRAGAGILASATVVLLAIVSLGGLLVPTTYARETPNWATQAIAQDWFDLVVATPVIAGATVAAMAGSLRARFVLCGGLLFAAYTLAIYCFSVHLNPLFLVYCAGFGTALFGCALTGARLLADREDRWFDGTRIPRRFSALALLSIGSVFALLWLAQLIPAARTGVAPRELVEAGLPTNPVHVLDLAVVLPLHLIAGIALWRGRPLGLVLAPVLLAFGSLMAASIAGLLVLLEIRGLGHGGVPIAIAMTAISILEVALLVGMLRGARARAMQPLRA